MAIDLPRSRSARLAARRPVGAGAMRTRAVRMKRGPDTVAVSADGIARASAPQVGIFAGRWVESVLGAVALVALVFNQTYGFLAALTFVLSSFMLIALRLQPVVRSVGQFAPLLALPLLAIISTMWSDAPSLTMRAGIEITITYLTTIAVAMLCPPRTSILALLAGFAFLAFQSLPDAPYIIGTNMWMRGVFSSKNALGYNAALLFILALAVTLDREHRFWIRLLALACVPVALLEVDLSRSSGAQANAAVSLLLLPALLLFGRFPKGLRLAVAVTLFGGIAYFVVFNSDVLAALDTLRGSLGKDATLTGRTYLWDVGRRVGGQTPWLGHGYYSFWRLGSIEAEALWRKFGIMRKSGFNFHNSFIEMYVDLGLAGSALLIVTSISATVAALVRQVRAPTSINATFLALQASLYLRAVTETSLFLPLYTGTSLWVLCCVFAFRKDTAGSPLALPAPMRATPTDPRQLPDRGMRTA